MSYVKQVSLPAMFALTMLVGLYGCGKSSSPPPGAPDETSNVTVDQGTEAEPEATGEKGTEEPTAKEEPTTDEADSTSDDAAAGGDGQWGTLTGRIVYDGPPPKPEPIDTSKDPNCKEKLTTENLLVGPDGGLKNAVVMLRTKDVPVNPEYEQAADEQVKLDNKNCRFEPHVQVVRLSQKLMLTNSDPTGHNSNIAPLLNPGLNPVLAAGGEPVPYQFETEEALPVKVSCNIHPWMGAWIVARKDPYAAVTDADGKFTIKDLPAGKELEFRLWQESAGYLKDAKFKGGKADRRGTFKFKIKPGTNDMGDINVSSTIFKK